jgi:hypothetical protein
VVEQADRVEQGRHDVEEDEPGDIFEDLESSAVAGDDETRRDRQQQADEKKTVRNHKRHSLFGLDRAPTCRSARERTALSGPPKGSVPARRQ